MKHLLTTMLVCSISLLLLSGCGEQQPTPSSDRDAVRMTVTRYNRLLAEGYRTMDMTRLREVAEELQAEDEYIHMSAMAEGGVRLLPLLKEREFLKTSVEETSAVVETREVWDYRHEQIATREISLIQSNLTYKIAWDLVRHDDGRWYVKDVRAIEASAGAPAQRPATSTSDRL